MSPVSPVAGRPFDAQEFLETAGVSRRVVNYRRNTVVYSQGDIADTVIYIQRGGVRLSVVSTTGKEAIVATLGPSEFFGEGCLAGQAFRMTTAATVAPSTLLLVEKAQMQRILHEQHDLSDLFITYVLARNIRIEEDLVDQLFNSSEKRLARTLLMLSRFGTQDEQQRVLPRVSQSVLAEMVGTTRSRINLFMNKFRKLGFIEYNGDIRVNSSLLSVVLHD
jgi:CRP/FNR family transcriptional regulator, cyclic AMP receptor protein